MVFKLIIIRLNALHSNRVTLGAVLSLGCMIGFFGGGYMSQLIGKRIMMVVSNFASFVLWIMMAQTYKVQFITLERFAMGVVSAGAIVCVGRIDLQLFFFYSYAVLC